MDVDRHFQDRRVLITGGLGFIGSNLARRLVALGTKVLLVDSLVPEHGGRLFNIADIQDRVTVELGDVRDEASMGQLIRGQDYLFNLAGQSSHIDSMRFPQVDMEMNCRAHLSVLEACRQHNPDVRAALLAHHRKHGAHGAQIPRCPSAISSRGARRPRALRSRSRTAQLSVDSR